MSEPSSSTEQVDVITDLRARVAKSDESYKQGDIDAAIALLLPLVEEKVDYFRPYMNLGFYYWLKGDCRSAIPQLETALAKVPRFPNALNLLGRSLVVNRQYERGLAHLRAFRELAPDDKSILLWEARALWGLNRADEASELLRDVAAASGWRTPLEKGLQFSQEPWFLTHIENWSKHLAPLYHKVERALEIGCMEGMSAIWTMDHLVDPRGRLEINDIEFRPNFVFNIEASGYRDRIDLRPGDSGNILPTLPEKRYDFIYVDGDHSATGVFRDCVNACIVAKSNAFIVLDDYGKANEATKFGIDLFLSVFGKYFTIVEKGYQIFLKRKPTSIYLSAADRKTIVAAVLPQARADLENLSNSSFLGKLRHGVAAFKERE